MDKLVVSVQECRKEVPAVVCGHIPSWLNGSLLRVGPGKWDLKDGFSMNHYLDGCACITKMNIEDGKVSFSSRFLESDAYKKMLAHGKPVYTEFGTKAHADPSKNLFTRFVNTIVPCDLTDNDISNIYAMQNEVYVATESCNIWRIDPKNLEAKNKLNLDKMVGVSICGSHPHVDMDGVTYNLGASFLSGMKYHIMQIPPLPEKSELIEDGAEARAYKKAKILCTIPSSYKTCFSYTHSFAMTEHFIIFLEQPLLVNGFKLATCTPKGKPLQDCLEWHPEEPTRFHVIHKSTGNVYKVKYHSEALYHFHNINAYEDGEFIVLDVIAYDDAHVLDKYNLSLMRNNEWDSQCPPVPRRFVLPLGDIADFKIGSNLVKIDNCDAKAIKNEKGIIDLISEQLGPAGFELPIINKNYNARKYRYVYGSGVFEKGYYANAISKLDLVTKQAELWKESDTLFPGEPVFIPKPGGMSEDDGVLLSVALEADQSKNHLLLVVDAKSMKELARVEMSRDDIEIPTTIHGIFVPSSH
jgi:carotenoid cleavage dioxygenase-like enzyme